MKTTVRFRCPICRADVDLTVTYAHCPPTAVLDPAPVKAHVDSHRTPHDGGEEVA